MSAATSALNARGGSLALPMIIAICGHCFAIFLLIAGQWLADLNRDPILDVKEVQVSLTLKPKTDRKMEQKATRKAVQAGTVDPVIVKETPKPPKVSEMKIEKPDVKEAKGAPDRSDDAISPLELLRRQAAMEAALGSVDQDAASPDSTTDESINATGPGGRADPELARYQAKLQQLFRDKFRPLPNLTDMQCVLWVKTDPGTGRIVKYALTEKSGNASYDSACLRTAEAVGSLPLPPEKWRAHFANGYKFRLKPKS